MRFLLTSALVFAVGCVGTADDVDGGNNGSNGSNGGGGGGGGGTAAGRAEFKASVHPILQKCSGGGCHDTNGTSGTLSRFYNTNADTSYDATVGLPDLVKGFQPIAPLVTHLEPNHKGLTYTPAEKTAILKWLQTEATARAGTTPTPVVDSKALLKEWSGCLSLANFQAANMATAWGNLAGTNLQRCVNCHQTGLGILINLNAQTFFDGITKNLALMLKYFTVSTADAKVVINTGSFQASLGVADHPQFNVTNNAGMTALKKLYDDTVARKAANQCDPPRLVD
jgi:hypothetical protein